MNNPPEESGEAVRHLEGQHRRERSLSQEIRDMHEDDLVDFIRDAVVRLDALADRLEVYADNPREERA